VLHVRICNADGAVIAEGTCSDSGYFPVALASVYNAALKLVPARSVDHLDGGSGSADTLSARAARRSGTAWAAVASLAASWTTR
jgi:hypothetical protein